MSALVGEKAKKYVPFWENFLSKAQVDVKHQYMRLKFENDAIVLWNYLDNPNPIVDAVTDYLRSLGKSSTPVLTQE